MRTDAVQLAESVDESVDAAGTACATAAECERSAWAARTVGIADAWRTGHGAVGTAAQRGVSPHATRLRHHAAMHGRPADFRLYASNALEVLAGLLAEALRTPAPGQPLLAPDIVLIPQAAMRRWLQATLAETHGIAANITFLAPGEFVARALEANLGRAQDDELTTGTLHWRLYAALTTPAAQRAPPLRALQSYLDGDPLRPWSLAGELAAVFGKYQAWRRDWLLAWERGADRDDLQATLWRQVAAGRSTRAARIGDYLARFGAHDAALPHGLPARLFAFATINNSPDVLRVIATQARVGTLHFYLPTPTRTYWGDLQTRGERLRAPDADVFGALRENPLLEAWGGAGRDFMAVLGSYETVHPTVEIAAYDDPETRPGDNAASDSLLRRLQRDLLHRRPATPGWRSGVDRGDASLQVHACHTRLREVQVLHDQLRALLDPDSAQGCGFDPPLQPREIAVLAPDIDPYVPYIEAVFGGRRGQPDFLSYAVADTSPLAAEPVAAVFLQLLQLPLLRFGLSEILDLLAAPPLAEAAQLDADALDRLRLWLRDAGARWALDAAHRARHDAPADDAYTWAFALDRLLLGHASGADAEIAGVAPWPDLEGGALDALDTLIRVLRVLARHQRRLGEALPPLLWRERLLGLLDALLPQAPRELGAQRALARLRQQIDGFARDAVDAGHERPVPADVVRAHFARVLGEADTRAPLLTGGISFGRMVPMRLLPFRVLCVLGMNDGDYPRRDPAAGLNRLAAELGGPRRRFGDRSLRDDDRYLFLQLLATASEVFYLSYAGADPRDGSVREPSLLVTELLDAAAGYHGDCAAAREALVLRHPLQPFAPTAFGDAGEPRRFSYRGEWHRAAVSGAPSESLPVFAPAPVVRCSDSAVAPEPVALAALRRLLVDPADAYLRQTLAMRLPEPADTIDDVEPLAAPGRGLERSLLQRAVFDAWVASDTGDLAAHLRARAMLPAGAAGQRALDEIVATVAPVAAAFAGWRGGEAIALLPLSLPIGRQLLQARVEGRYPAGLARFRFDLLHGPAQVAHGLDWLLLGAAGEQVPLMQFDLHCDQVRMTPRPAINQEAARAALGDLLALRVEALRMPLPFGARAGWTWYDAEQARRGGSRRARRDPWEAAREAWHNTRAYAEGDTPAACVALRGRDPFDAAAVGAQFRQIAVRVFDAVVHGRANPEGRLHNAQAQEA